LTLSVLVALMTICTLPVLAVVVPEIIPAFRQPLEAALRCGCCRCLALG
jgi:hypothetical protein